MPLHPDAIQLDLPATNKYLSVLGACLDSFIERIEGIDEPRITAYNIQLAVNEIFVNIATHAYVNRPDGRVDVLITVQPSPRHLLVELHDSGISFDPASVAIPDLDNPQIHGYGLFLAHSLMDDVSYQPRPDGNSWRLIKYL